MSRVRAATVQDISILISIERDSPTAAHWSETQYRAALGGSNDPERVCLVIEEEAVVGFVMARVLDDEWEIENVVMANPARRRGLGSQLMNKLLELAKARSAQSVFLEVRESNQAARRLYEKWGFALAGRRRSYYTDPSEDALLFRYNFPQQLAKGVEGPGGVC